jgi:hypothetical protein
LRTVRDGFRIDIRYLIRGLRLLPNLILRNACLCRRTLFMDVRGADFAQASLTIPAILRTDPNAASGTLFEMRSHFLDGIAKRLIVLPAANGTLDLVRIRSGRPEKSTQDLSRAA